MGTVVDSLAGALERANLVRTLPGHGGIGNRNEERRTVHATIGIVVGTVAHHVSDAVGARAVWSVVAGDDGWLIDQAEDGESDELLRIFFGSTRTVLERRLVDHTGLDQITMTAFLGTVLGVYLEHLRRRVVIQRLDPPGLRRVVLDEHREAAAAVPLTGLFATVAVTSDEFHEALRRLHSNRPRSSMATR